MVSQAAELELRLIARDEMTKIFDKTKQSGGELEGVFGNISKIAAGFTIGAALTKLPGFLMDAAKAASEDEASTLRVQRALQNTGTSIEDYQGKLDAAIKSGQDLAFSDDEIRDSLSMLAAETGSSEEAFSRLQIAQDLARGTGMDLVTASKLLGKVTDENINVLKRYGISVEKGASETELLAAVQTKFGGQAQAFADSTAGQMQKAQIAIQELKESIGYALIPIMQALTEILNGAVIPAMDKAIEGWKGLIDLTGSAIDDLKSGINDLSSMVGLGDVFDTEPVLTAAQAAGDYNARLKELGETEAQDLTPAQRGADQALKDYIESIKTGTEEAKGFNETLGGMISMYDQLKNVPTPEMLALQSAQASVNAEYAKAKQELDTYDPALVAHVQQLESEILSLTHERDAIGTTAKERADLNTKIAAATKELQSLGPEQVKNIDNTNSHISALEREKQRIDDELNVLKTNREAVAAAAKERDSAKQAADGWARSEEMLMAKIDATANRMPAAAAAAQAYVEVMLRAAQLAITQAFGGERTDIPLPPRDSGGPVSAGHAYMIGLNRRPEIFVPNSSGQVYPMDSTGNGVPMASPIVNVYVSGSILTERELMSLFRDAINEGGFRAVVGSN